MKKQCKVELLNYTPLWVCSSGVRTCWDSQAKEDSFDKWYCDADGCSFETPSLNDMDTNFCGNFICPECGSFDIIKTKDTGDDNRKLIDRVGNKFKHASTLEHLFYNFHLSGFSRALLQELARHRMASLSVKSTRYTLKELKKEEPFNDFANISDFNRASKYLVWTGNQAVDANSFYALEDLRLVIVSGVSNDTAKYNLCESYKTECAWTINARSLQNFLHLRTDKAALLEIRLLAGEIFNQLPEEHKYLFTDSVRPEAKQLEVN